MSSEQERETINQEEIAAIANEVFGEDEQPGKFVARRPAGEQEDAGHRVDDDDRQAVLREEEAGEQDDGQPEPEKEQPDQESPGHDSRQADDGEDPDPWEGVPPMVRQTLENLTSKIDGIDQQTYRLKQVESRLGGVINELHAAKQAATETKNAPTKEEMAAATKSDEDWQNLKDEYPEWADIMDGIKTMIDAKPGKASVEELRTTLRDELKQELGAGPAAGRESKEEVELALTLQHPKWRQDISSPEWDAYLDTLDPATRQGVLSTNTSSVAIAALNAFDKFRESRAAANKQETTPPSDKAAEIARKRSARVEQSAVHHSQKSSKAAPRPKSERDMTEAELRQVVAAEVFDDKD